MSAQDKTDLYRDSDFPNLNRQQDAVCELFPHCDELKGLVFQTPPPPASMTDYHVASIHVASQLDEETARRNASAFRNQVCNNVPDSQVCFVSSAIHYESDWVGDDMHRDFTPHTVHYWYHAKSLACCTHAPADQPALLRVLSAPPAVAVQ